MKTPFSQGLRIAMAVLLVGLATGCSLLSRKAAGPPPGQDKAIASQIRAALSKEPAVRDAEVSVHCSQGIVELAGTVGSTAAKSRAGLIAASTPGVAQVHNDLLVRGGPAE